MPRRILEGNVVSDKMDKTVTVLVERRYKHPMYNKIVKRSDRFAAHDETNACQMGDRVQIQECRPISKRKTWTVISGAASAAKKEAAKKTTAPKADVKTEAPKADSKKPAAKAAAKTTSKKKDDKN